jgi:hypothetical protein
VENVHRTKTKKEAGRGNLRLTSLRDYHSLSAMIAQIFASHKSPPSVSRFFPQIIHKRPEHFGAVDVSQFLDFWCKNTSHLLYILRIDNSAFVVYNKARNQRSTAEAQTRANPADLKQKGARPMVDMEPAQFGQTVGIR